MPWYASIVPGEAAFPLSRHGNNSDAILTSRRGRSPLVLTGGRMRRQQGFTLIEIMIAVAIIGILATIAMASYMGYTRRAANSACLAEARGQLPRVMIAINHNQPLPALQTSACTRITLAPDQKSLTAYPVSPGDKGVWCDLDSSTVCTLSDAVTP